MDRKIRSPRITALPYSDSTGNVLLIVVLLLLLSSVLVLFSLRVGGFEQKTSGNDYRAKLVQELAESGIHQGAEYFAGNPTIRTDMGNWDECDTADESFPCGAVSENSAVDASVPRRSTMYKFVGGTGSGLDEKLIPLPSPITSTGGFAATQQVGAVLCRIKRPTSPSDPTSCATNDAEASSIWAMTLVSKGALTSEGSSSTVVQTIGSYGVFNFGTNIPPVIASGSVSVGGGLQIVTAPNGGGLGVGSGVPVSVWTRLDMGTSGTPNTCYMEEFLRQGGSSSGPAYFDGIEVCHTCQCPGDGSLSYPQGSHACQGMDIVDIDSNAANAAGCPVAPNLDIRRAEFPPDLFAFVFPRRAWNDNDPGAGGDTAANTEFNFAETRRISDCEFQHPLTGADVTATLPEDTCYLLNINTITHIGDGVNDAAECNAIAANSRGIIWVHTQPIMSGGSTVAGMTGYDCVTRLRNIDDIGTPSHPVALIFDGSLTGVHFRLYGLLFVREPNASATLDDETGGSAELGLNAGATIYGAAIVQGEIVAGGGGTAAIVYNEKVLSNLVNDPDIPPDPNSLPGSWTDRVRY
jgi:Tfp pilus assembly protein PilX